MDYIYLITAVFCVASSGIFAEFYNRKHEGVSGASPLYTFVLLSSAFILWSAVYLVDFSFDPEVLIYAVIFALCYTVSTVCFVNALRSGPLSLSSLFLQLSLIGVTVWGFFFWGEKVTALSVIGLLVIAVSLWLCLYTGKSTGEKLSKKWLIYIIFAFLGNAGCSISQRTQQTDFNGEHSGLFMCTAMLLSMIFSFVLFMKSDKTETRSTLKRSWYLPVIAAVCNVILNLFIMILATSSLSPTLIYPVIAVGAISINMIFSLFAFKEKLAWWQWLGVALGAVGVGVLSV